MMYMEFYRMNSINANTWIFPVQCLKFFLLIPLHFLGLHIIVHYKLYGILYSASLCTYIISNITYQQSNLKKLFNRFAPVKWTGSSFAFSFPPISKYDWSHAAYLMLSRLDWTNGLQRVSTILSNRRFRQYGCYRPRNLRATPYTFFEPLTWPLANTSPVLAILASVKSPQEGHPL